MYNAPFIVESWPAENPENRSRTGFANLGEADAFARALASDGEDAMVLAVETSYMAKPDSEAARSGLLPGRDFPVTLRRTARAGLG